MSALRARVRAQQRFGVTHKKVIQRPCHSQNRSFTSVRGKTKGKNVVFLYVDCGLFVSYFVSRVYVDFRSSFSTRGRRAGGSLPERRKATKATLLTSKQILQQRRGSKIYRKREMGIAAVTTSRGEPTMNASQRKRRRSVARCQPQNPFAQHSVPTVAKAGQTIGGCDHDRLTHL